MRSLSSKSSCPHPAPLPVVGSAALVVTQALPQEPGPASPESRCPTLARLLPAPRQPGSSGAVSRFSWSCTALSPAFHGPVRRCLRFSWSCTALSPGGPAALAPVPPARLAGVAGALDRADAGETRASRAAESRGRRCGLDASRVSVSRAVSPVRHPRVSRESLRQTQAREVQTARRHWCMRALSSDGEGRRA